MIKFMFPFLAPDDGLGGGGIVKTPTLGARPEKQDDDTDFLNNLLDKPGDKSDDKDDKTTDKEDKIVDKEEDENLLDEEEDLVIDKSDKDEEDEEDEDEDLISPETENNRGIDLKAVKEKFPEFAKTNEFRELRNAYHREAQFTELFPTIDDAREAAENNETFVKLNDALVSRGDVLTLLTAVKEASPEAAKKVVNNFLDSVAKFDQTLYIQAVTPVVRKLAKQIHAEGRKFLKRNPESEDGAALVATGRNILQFIEEDPDNIEKEEPRVSPEISEKEKELTEREIRIETEKFNSALSVAATSVERHLDKQILAGLDPNNTLNEFLRDSLLEKIKNEVKKQIDNDQPHIKRMGSLWKRAKSEGYNRESLSRIVSAYLERARPIIPAARNKFKSIALKGRKQSNENKDDNDNGSRREVRLPRSGQTGRAGGDGKINLRTVDPKKIDYSKTSDEDILSGRVTLKG